MPVTERYQVDFFAILVLIASVLIIMFLIISAIYFYNFTISKPPTNSESTFLFWTSIILGIIFLALAIYALIRIFTYTVPVYEEDKPLPVQVIPTHIPIMAPAQPISQPVIITPTPPRSAVPIPPKTQVAISQPTRISPVRTTRPTNLSQNVSDIPVTSNQRTALNQELISLGNALS
jgi:amino acid transporter